MGQQGNFGRDSHPRLTGYVYFVTDGELTKIGHSWWPLNRFKGLRSPSGATMTLLAWFRGAMEAEKGLHHYFASLNAPGPHGVEWFADDGRIASFIEHCKGWENHILAGRIGLLDIARGKLPDATHPDHVPLDPEKFKAWASPRCCGDWPAELQKATAHYAFGTGPFDAFLDAYEQWFGPTEAYR